jgi:membrane protein YdbS with pleckstrin-like domain
MSESEASEPLGRSTDQASSPEASEPQAPGATDLFDAPGLDWHRVSPRLTRLWQVTAAIFMGPPAVAATAGAIALHSSWLAAVLTILLALWGWIAWMIPRRVRAIGYAERDSDLVIRKGIMFRQVTVVPYGRMQYLDVTTGPMARLFGLAKLQLNTASPHKGGVIPGLDPAEATRLRDHLAERGDARMAGL